MQTNTQEHKLQKLLKAEDFQALDDLIGKDVSLTSQQIDQIAKAMERVKFGSLTLTKGWFSLAKKLLSHSLRLRKHVFKILGDQNTAQVDDAYRKTDRTNLLYALNSLKLTEEEIGVIRTLRDQISIAAYRDVCDEILFGQMSTDEQEEALHRIWRDARKNVK